MEAENLTFDYGELSDDHNFVETCENLQASLNQLQDVMKECQRLRQQSDKLSPEARIELNLFTLYTYNSLYWVYLRVQGIDPTKHPIKHELIRIKKVMMRWQEVKDKKHRPKVDKNAAKRFIRSGLWDPTQVGAATNKKIKFDDES